MQYHGVPAVRIHGDMAQYERTGALEALCGATAASPESSKYQREPQHGLVASSPNRQAFKSGQSPILCATDVAARGLDIKVRAA